MDWQLEATNASLYLAALEHLNRKASRLFQRMEFSTPGLTLSAVALSAEKYADRLAQVIRSGGYRLSPARVRMIKVDKERELYSFEFNDLVVHHALAQLLTRMLQPRMSSSLYSYRTGRSNVDAVRTFSTWIRAYTHSRPDPRTRGIYLLRCDVRRYTESIPVGDDAPVWDQFEKLLVCSRDDFGREGSLPWLIGRMIRPDVVQTDGSIVRPVRGVPTGSPISTLIANLYLNDLDHTLQGTPGCFYSRFGDDLLFAHPDPEQTWTTYEMIQSELKRLGLSLNPTKLRLIYLNGAGRASPDPRFQGSREIDYLGYSVDLRSQIRLKAQKVGEWKKDMALRISQTCALLGASLTREQLLTSLSRALWRAQDPSQPGATRHSQALRRIISDRRQLRELDRWLALQIARAATRIPGPQAFRTLSYRSLREAGLKSLEYSRRRSARRVSP